MTKMFIINQLKKTEATESFWSDILEIHKILQATNIFDKKSSNKLNNLKFLNTNFLKTYL